MKRTACILAVAALALSGCKKETQSDEAAATAQPAQTAVPAATAPAEPAVEEQIPTEEDFEEEALEEVNSGNLEEELDKLEKEIKGDTE